MSRSFQKRSTSSSISGKPARVETSANMDANSKCSRSAEELAEHVEHRDRDHRRKVDAEAGGNDSAKRPQNGLGDIYQEPHHGAVIIADEPGGRGAHEDGKDEQVNQDLREGVEVID